MGSQLELEMGSKAGIKISGSKEKGTLPDGIPEKTMHCTSNFEDHSFDVEDSTDDHRGKFPSKREDPQIDIVDCTNPRDHELEVSECEDATEYSSSFGGTESEPESADALSDHEVESPVYRGTPMSSVFDGFDGVAPVRKKRLTDHWRRFVQPIMWRCKWLELRIREFQSQARKYDKEVGEYYQKKQIEMEKLKSEESDTKSLHFSFQTPRKKVVKRKKRKRVEETTDISSYMSNHNVFSHYEYRKSYADGTLVVDNVRQLDQRTKNCKEEVDFNYGQPSLEFRDSDDYIRQILAKIEMAKSEAQKLKNRVDKVLSDYPGKFSSVNRLTVLPRVDASTSLDQKPISLPKSEDEKPVKSASTSSQHYIPECNKNRDVLMSDSAVSSHGDVKPTVEAMNEKKEQPSVRGSLQSGKKGSKRKQVANEEVQNLERAINQLTKKPRASKERPKTNSPTSRFKVPKRKRKRGKRRSGSAVVRRKS